MNINTVMQHANIAGVLDLFNVPNMFDFLPRTQTQLSLQDWMTQVPQTPAVTPKTHQGHGYKPSKFRNLM